MDEVQRLILQVQGQQDAERLRHVMEAEEKTLRSLNELLKQNGTLTAAQQQQQQRTAASYVANQKELKKLESGFRGLGAGSMQLSYAMQDLVAQNGDLLRGFMAIQNNMPGIITSFGGSMGLAATVSNVSLAISLALPLIMKFIDSLSPAHVDKFKDSLGVIRAQIDALKDKEIKIGTDATDIKNLEKMLERLQKGLEGFKQWERDHTDWEQKSGAKVGDIIQNAPEGKKALKAVQDEQNKQIESYAPLADARQKLKTIEDDIAKQVHAMNTARTDEEFTGAEARHGQLQKLRNKAVDVVTAQAEAAKEKFGQIDIGELYAKAKEGDQESREKLAEKFNKAGYDDIGMKIKFAGADELKKQAEYLEKKKNEHESRRSGAQTKREQEEIARTHKEYDDVALKSWEALTPEERERYTRGTKGHEGFRKFAQGMTSIVRQPTLPGQQSGADWMKEFQSMTPEQRAAARHEGETYTQMAQRWIAEQKQLRAHDRQRFEAEQKQTEHENAEARREQESAHDQLRSKLGQPFLVGAGEAQVGVNRIRNAKRRAQAQARLDAEIRRQAQQQLVTNAGETVKDAGDLASFAPDLVRKNLAETQERARFAAGQRPMSVTNPQFFEPTQTPFPMMRAAEAQDRARQHIIRERTAAEEGAADAAVAPGMYMNEAARNAAMMGGPAGGAGQLVQQASAAQNQLVQQLMRDNMEMRAYLQQMITDSQQNAGNFRSMQAPMAGGSSHSYLGASK